MAQLMATLNDTYSTTPQMAAILSDGRLLTHMAGFEAELAQAQADAGLIDRKLADTISAVVFPMTSRPCLPRPSRAARWRFPL